VIPTGTGPLVSHLAIPGTLRRLPGWVAVAAILAACGSAVPAVPPPITAGSADRPREVNIIAKDYSYLPSVVDLVPGETVLLHVVNGGLDVHEVVIGDATIQAAWETAETVAAAVGGPPGATPAISVPPGLEGLRVVVRSGERVDVTWTVPRPPAPGATSTPLIVGCHIPGHWAKGMQVPIRFVTPAGS
jgi:uncharacterized cupredoxin-like copper-binding protein